MQSSLSVSISLITRHLLEPRRRTRAVPSGWLGFAGIAMLALSLAGCGSGSGDRDPIDVPLPTPPAITPPPVDTTTPPPPPPPPSNGSVPRFAYVGDGSDYTISIYAVDAQSGQLRANGYSVNFGVSVHHLTVDPSNTFVYAIAGLGTNAGVFVARINAETGALTPVAGSPFATGRLPTAIAIDPNGRFAYVADSDSNSLYAYAIDASTGAVAPVAGSPFATGALPDSVAVEPTGRFVYVTNRDSGSVSAFSIDSANGDLTPIAGSPFVSGVEPSGIAINSSGTLAFVANRGPSVSTGTISAFRIDQASGALALIESTAVVNGLFPEFIAVNPAGSFLYVSNGGSNNVSGFTIGANGALTEVAGSPYATGRGALAVLVDPSGNFVYVATGRTNTNDIAAFRIDSNSGALTPLPAAPYTASRSHPRSLAIAAGTEPVTFKSDFVYTANALSNDISAYAVEPRSGTLAAVPGAPFAAGTGPVALAIDPANRFVYVVNLVSNNISAFSIELTTGALAPVAGSPFAVDLSGMGAIAIEPSGRFLYVTGVCPIFVCFGNAVAAYSIDAGTGALAQVADSPYALALNVPEGSSGANAITVDPRGRTLYVTSGNASATVALRINTLTGALTPVDGSPFDGEQAGHTSIAIHPTGKFAYVSLGGAFFNSIYKIDSILELTPGPNFIYFVITGALEPSGVTPVSLNSATSSIGVDPTGRFVYALDGSANQIRGYHVNGQTGELTSMAGMPVATGGAAGIRLTTDASGRFVYALNATSNNVSAFAIDPANGSLTAVPGSPFAAGASPRAIGVSRSPQ